MNISKFLLIDTALLIAATSVLYFIQGENRKSSLLGSSNQENLLEETYINLPEKGELLELEKIAEVEGTGIEFDSLLGNWKFVSVWKKDTDEKDSAFNSLLRFFFAKLELQKDLSVKNPLKFLITASIQFGIISIEFSGIGYLKGDKPFLPFFFNLIEFKLGSNVLFSRSLKEPLDKDKSFFALIAFGGRWLSARGQGGALILWLKD